MLVIHTRLYRLVMILVPEQSCVDFPFTFRTVSIGNFFNSLFRLRVVSCDSHPISTIHGWKHVVADAVSQSPRHRLAFRTNVPVRHDHVRRNSAFKFYNPHVAVHDSRGNCVCGIASTRALTSRTFPWYRQRKHLRSLYLYRPPVYRCGYVFSRTGTPYDSTLVITFWNNWLRLASSSYTRVAYAPE